MNSSVSWAKNINETSELKKRSLGIRNRNSSQRVCRVLSTLYLSCWRPLTPHQLYLHGNVKHADTTVVTVILSMSLCDGPVVLRGLCVDIFTGCCNSILSGRVFLHTWQTLLKHWHQCSSSMLPFLFSWLSPLVLDDGKVSSWCI